MIAQKSLSITLPFPPTLNTYWRSVMVGKAPRVLISRRGREYRSSCGHQIYAQRIPLGVLSGKLSVEILALPPDRRERDLDNLLKGLLDALQENGVIRDDADIDDLRILRGKIQKGGAVRVTISEVNDDDDAGFSRARLLAYNKFPLRSMTR